MHKIALSPDMVARVTKRRGGKLHAIDRLDPARTALIVIDMQNVWVKPGMPAYTPTCEGIVPNINRLAAAMRAAGGSVWWVRAIYGDDTPRTWSAYMEFLDKKFVDGMLAALSEGNEGAALWHALDIRPGDEHVIKRRFSALIQGSSDLDARLRRAGIDTVIVTGTATNVCCESTARDAFMLNYRTLVVSDANATTSDEAHNASLNALFNRFADVFTLTMKPSDYVVSQRGSTKNDWVLSRTDQGTSSTTITLMHIRTWSEPVRFTFAWGSTLAVGTCEKLS